MAKTILITGATDGIGLAAAKALHADGHTVLIHGRNAEKLKAAIAAVGASDLARVRGVRADLTTLSAVDALADEVLDATPTLDVLINNAGVLKPGGTAPNGLDVRFVVNTLAPYRLAQRLWARIGGGGRIVNLSSAAQAPVDLKAFETATGLADFEAYAQSKLALTMWTAAQGGARGADDPMMVAVNPGSLLATKMVREGFGQAGADIGIGVDILLRAALSDEFADASGAYFDNDARRFADPHPDARDPRKCAAVVAAIEAAVARA